MQPDATFLVSVRRIARKEWSVFFQSTIAYLFLAVFSGVSLFVFFWGEAFYARNVADVAPLFKWMPILFIFLCSALTMRTWSEERRSGTLEHVLTQPIPLWHFVLGKFIGGLVVVAVALVITLPIPISVWIMAGLDWGPVVAGYLASLLLGAAYLAIGQFASARSDNPIVALLLSVAIGSLFYVVGASQFTAFFGQTVADFLAGLSTGARFEDITRGVIDLRDFYYFISLAAVFLVATVFSLERERWISDATEPRHVHWRWATTLLIGNLLVANLWLGYFTFARIDTTAGQQYSLTDTTKSYLNRLQEPLLIRGYFSDKTHPLLAPLVPQLSNLLAEYDVASRLVNVDIVDPQREPELEQEAREKYGIQAVPFQLADRYQSSIVSSYFNVLVQYGDEYDVLDFEDLIDVRNAPNGDIDVQLRNAEFDITKSIKTVIQRFQSAGNIFDTIKQPIHFTAYVSADARLPETLVTFKNELNTVLDSVKAKANSQFTFELIDPDANGGAVAEELATNYGFQPMATSLLSDQTFYFYMVMGTQDQKVQIPLGDLQASTLQKNIDSGLQRFSDGFTKTIALVAPEQDYAAMSQGLAVGKPAFQQLENWLGNEWQVIHEDLSDGQVSGNADALLVLAPEGLNDNARFAIDQYLMQGGTVLLGTSPYNATLQNRNLVAQRYDSGLTDWLAHMGVQIEDSLVMDRQSGAFPVPVTRNIGGLRVQEMQMLPYPYFLDVRGDSLNQTHPVLAGLPQLNMSWASPIKLDEALGDHLKISRLVTSSDQAQLSQSLTITPTGQTDMVRAVQPTGEHYLLAAALEGEFTSYYADKDQPTISLGSDDAVFDVTQVIGKSPASARLIVFASNTFLSDQVLQLAAAVNRSAMANNLSMMSNLVDWSVEDAGLMNIRTRGAYSQTLPPMTETTQRIWEYGNYLMSVLLILMTGFLAYRSRRKAQQHWYSFLAETKGEIA